MTTSANNELLISRTFNAPRALVWRAWTDPAHIRQWWGPAGFNNTACEADLRVGGKFRLEMRAPDGSLYPCVGIYREIVAPERIIYESEADDSHPCGSGLPPRSVVTLTLTEQGGKTMLTLHTRFDSVERKEAAAAARFVVSWEEGLERLDDFLTHA